MNRTRGRHRRTSPPRCAAAGTTGRCCAPRRADVPLPRRSTSRSAGPKPAEIGEDLAAVREWIAALDAGPPRRHATTPSTCASVGGRHFGRNHIPARALVSSVRPGVGAARRHRSGAALRPGPQAGERQSRRAKLGSRRTPIGRCELADEWAPLLAAYAWLDDAPRLGTLPSGDQRPRRRHEVRRATPGSPGRHARRRQPASTAFVAGSGPARQARHWSGSGSSPGAGSARCRLPRSPSGPTSWPSSLAPRNSASSSRTRSPTSASTVPEDGVVVWGKGFEVDRVGRLPWLVATAVVYWGDLDTHGFAILDRLRAWLPHTRSFLMDRETLLAHRDRWVVEERPATSVLDAARPGESRPLRRSRHRPPRRPGATRAGAPRLDLGPRAAAHLK